MLLESGSLVAPGGWPHLVARSTSTRAMGLGSFDKPLLARSVVYLAQRATPDRLPEPRGEPNQVSARDPVLEPLHSLADFCYSRSPQVIARIGSQ